MLNNALSQIHRPGADHQWNAEVKTLQDSAFSSPTPAPTLLEWPSQEQRGPGLTASAPVSDVSSKLIQFGSLHLRDSWWWWSSQWRAEIWWCPGRLLDWIPPYQILVFSSGVWWSLLLDIRCLWHHNMTWYWRLQTNVLAKFVDTTRIFGDAGEAIGQGAVPLPRRAFCGLSHSKESSEAPKLNYEAL